MLALEEKLDRTWRARDSVNGMGNFEANFLKSNNGSNFEADPYGFGEVAKETTANNVKNYTYRADGKIATYQDRNTQASYFYDGLDRLSAKAINANGVQFMQSFVNLADEDRVLLGKAGDGSMTSYIDGQGVAEHLGEVKGSVAKGYITDHLGSVMNSPVAGFGRSFGLFGEKSQAIALSQGMSPVIYGFAGYSIDGGSGLYETENRVYSASIGRWLQQDPIGLDGDDMNIYRYVSNNPLLYTDPEGLHMAYQDVGGGGLPWWLIPYLVKPMCPMPDKDDNLAFSKGGRQNVRDTGLRDLSDEEIMARARDKSLSGEERRRYQKEEKARGLRNKQKR